MTKRGRGATDSDPGTAIAAIWTRHRGDALDRVTALEDAVAALLENRLTEETRRAAEQDAHRLAGSAGTFGFLPASESARQLEGILAGTGPIPAAGMLRAAEEVVALRAAFGAASPPAPAARPSSPGAPGTSPGTCAGTSARPRHRAAGQEQRQEQRQEQLRPRRAASVLVEPGFPDDGGIRMLTGPGPAGQSVPAIASVPADTANSRAETVLGQADVARTDARRFRAPAVPPQQRIDTMEGLPPGAPATATVLVVDGDPAVLAAAGAVLVAEGLRVLGLDGPAQFWAAFEQEQPDLVILDLDLSEGSGGEVCRMIRSNATWAGLPVLFLTAGSDHATVTAVFAAGADDFVAKPFCGPELLARVQNRLERTRLLRAQLEIDPLTGLTTRRRAELDLQLLLGLAERHSQPLSVAVLDLDGFKDVNEQHGHAMGDAVLRHIGFLLRQSFRREDVVARWGGHKFLLGLHGMAREDGRQLIASLLQALHEERFVSPSGSPVPVTFSAGLATYPGDGATLTDLCEAAVPALFHTRRVGGEQVLPASAVPGGEYNVDVVAVEDDSALAELLEHALTTRGYRFRHLADGRAAVEQLAGSAPALRARVLLLDVNLPVLNGFGVLRQMADAGTLSGTRVIVLTARSGEEEVIKALELGAFDHVAKPFSVPVLMQRIRRALEA